MGVKELLPSSSQGGGGDWIVRYCIYILYVYVKHHFFYTIRKGAFNINFFTCQYQKIMVATCLLITVYFSHNLGGTDSRRGSPKKFNGGGGDWKISIAGMKYIIVPSHEGGEELNILGVVCDHGSTCRLAEFFFSKGGGYCGRLLRGPKVWSGVQSAKPLKFLGFYRVKRNREINLNIGDPVNICWINLHYFEEEKNLKKNCN